MHCIAWHIIFFLKYLRSLEEFRKNPYVKIPPKSPSTNFQSLGKFKTPIFIQKEFFLRIQPTRPSRPVHSPSLGLPAGTSRQPPPWPTSPTNCLLSLTTGPRSPSSSSGRAGLRHIPPVPQPHLSRHGHPPPPVQDPFFHH
jgi:hypothetical protein